MRPRNLPPVLLWLRLEQMALLMPEAPVGLSDWLAELHRIRSERALAFSVM